MEWFVVACSAFFASWLTFYVGFGLGTLLMPMVALFFPLPIAIALTAIVHLLHNMFKTGLLWKRIHWMTAVRFGIPATLFAMIGAWLLKQLSLLPPLHTYAIFGREGRISILHGLIGILLIVFATAQWMPHKNGKIKSLFWGGALSGFFGGLSGNQGAFRSLFLVYSHLGKEAFIATNGVIATAVDLVRLVVYGMSFQTLWHAIDPYFTGITILGALLGILMGMSLLKKVSLSWMQNAVIVFLYVLGFLFIMGVV